MYTSVSTSSKYLYSHYNSIQTTVATVLNTGISGYGILPRSTPVNSGMTASRDQWNNLYHDIDILLIHQNGTGLTPSAPSTSTSITAQFVNALGDAADYAVLRKNLAHSSQLLSYSTASTRTSSWGYGLAGQGITMVTEHQWPDLESMRWYFNLGGSIVANINYISGSGSSGPYPAQETQVQEFITNSKSKIATPFTRGSLVSLLSTSTFNRIITTSTQYFDGFNTATYYLKLITQLSDDKNALRSTVQLIPDGSLSLSSEIFTDIVATMTHYVSRGDLGGIAAPAPQYAIVSNFENAEAAIIPRQIVDLSTSLSSMNFEFRGNSVSGSQILTVYNNGNSTATITNLVFTNYGAVGTGQSSSLTIAPGGSTDISIRYDATAFKASDIGLHNNSLRIVSNNTKHDVIVPITVNLLKPVFDFNILPSTVGSSVTSIAEAYTTLRIESEFGNIQTISFSVSSTSSNGFSILNEPISSRTGTWGTLSGDFDPGTIGSDGIKLKYEPFDITAGLYTATLSVTVSATDIEGLTVTRTKTATWVINQNISDRNVSSWVSPIGPFNSVIGSSVDIIGGKKYLTLGVGMGADGAPSIDSGGKTYIDVRNLGYEGGSSYTYWAEVYRFPIDAKTKTMQSFFYMVKSTEKIIGGQVDFIGDYFGVVGTSTPRSMFTVNTNEVGRCYIGINPLNDSLTPTVTDSLTLSNLIYSFYYFETTIARYSHLEDASAGTTTRYFTGFNYKGTVQTDIRAYRSGPKGSIINSIVTFLATTYIADLIVIELGLFKVEVTEWLGVTYTQSTSFGIYLMDAAGIDVGGAQTLVEYLANAYSASAESGLISKVLLDVTNAQTALANGVPVAEALAAPETTAFLVELGIEESIAIAVPPVALAVGVVLIAPKVVQFVEDHPVESVAIIGAILCGGICFTGDTVVKTADGSYKKISEFSGGEEVLNHDGSSVNKVRLVIKNLDYTGTLCGLESDPFVTVNHPLIINGRLSSFNPEHIIENNPWLGPCEKISSSSNREAQGETVYNLLVTGDGTYTVNNIGTTSVFGSGGVLVDCMHQGLISEDQVFAIIKKYHDLGGSQLANFYQIIHSKEYNDISQASTSIAKLM